MVIVFRMLIADDNTILPYYNKSFELWRFCAQFSTEQHRCFKSAHCRSEVGYIAGARVGLLRGTALLRRLHFSGTLRPCTHAPLPHPSPRGTKCLFGLQRHGTKCHTIADAIAGHCVMNSASLNFGTANY